MGGERWEERREEEEEEEQERSSIRSLYTIHTTQVSLDIPEKVSGSFRRDSFMVES